MLSRVQFEQWGGRRCGCGGVVIPEDDVVKVGSHCMDLQEQQETSIYTYGESLFALTLQVTLDTPCPILRLGMNILWQSNSIPIRAWLVYGALQIENSKH